MKNASKLFCPKNIKFVELSHFAHSYDFHVWSDGVHDFAKTSGLTQKLKICSLFIFKWLSDDGVFLFFIFGDEKQIPEFFTAIFRPKLHDIIINNY